MVSVGKRGYGNTRHTWFNNSHKISIARWNHIKLESKHNVLNILYYNTMDRVQGHYYTQNGKHHDTTELQCNRIARRHTPKLTTTIIPKMTTRSTFLLDVVHRHPSYPLKHHCPQLSLVELVTVVQPGSSDPGQTYPTAPPGVPILDVAAVKPL
jgi:hypothetical protein